MILHVTYCSKDKSSQSGKIPASERYSSDRIKNIQRLSKKRDENFSILSGKFGLIKADTLIPEYDKLLVKEDVPEMLPKVREQLRKESPSKVIYHTREVEGKRVPYFQLLKKACSEENVDLEKKLI